MTGIQVGHWLYAAPDFDAAKFLARQSLEEMQHVDNFLRIMTMLGLKPGEAHWAVRFLSTGMMGGSWAEHVALEMAQGEGFVLMAFYAVIDTLDHKPSTDILRRAVKQEERHVEFGERETQKAIAGKAWLRRRLLGLSLVSMWGVRRLARYMGKRMPADHPVLRHFPEFLALSNRCAETRLRRIGVLDRPLAELGPLRRAVLVAEAHGGKALGGLVSLVTLPLRLLPFWPRKKRLTDVYLADPHVAGKSIGVGQYQHDVDQKALKRSLDDVVGSCVNAVGVEVNTASKQLLSYVAGLNGVTAANIILHRNEHGPFTPRGELLKVKRLGPKAFEQAAGFLRIRNGDNPLDASAVHPESYGIVERMAADLACTVPDLMTRADLRAQIRLDRYLTDTSACRRCRTSSMSWRSPAATRAFSSRRFPLPRATRSWRISNRGCGCPASSPTSPPLARSWTSASTRTAWCTSASSPISSSRTRRPS